MFARQHAATRCNTLLHAATRCNTLALENVCQTTRCNTLQHAATRCNTLHHIGFGECLPDNTQGVLKNAHSFVCVPRLHRIFMYMWDMRDALICICETPWYVHVRILDMYMPGLLRMSHVTHAIHVCQECTIPVRVCETPSNLCEDSYEWVMSHMWFIQVSHVYVSLLHICANTPMSESCYACDSCVCEDFYEWVMSHMRFMGDITHPYMSHMTPHYIWNDLSMCKLTHIWIAYVTSLIYMCGVTHSSTWLDPIVCV